MNGDCERRPRTGQPHGNRTETALGRGRIPAAANVELTSRRHGNENGEPHVHRSSHPAGSGRGPPPRSARPGTGFPSTTTSSKQPPTPPIRVDDPLANPAHSRPPRSEPAREGARAGRNQIDRQVGARCHAVLRSDAHVNRPRAPAVERDTVDSHFMDRAGTARPATSSQIAAHTPGRTMPILETAAAVAGAAAATYEAVQWIADWAERSCIIEVANMTPEYWTLTQYGCSSGVFVDGALPTTIAPFGAALIKAASSTFAQGAVGNLGYQGRDVGLLMDYSNPEVGNNDLDTTFNGSRSGEFIVENSAGPGNKNAHYRCALAQQYQENWRFCPSATGCSSTARVAAVQRAADTKPPASSSFSCTTLPTARTCRATGGSARNAWACSPQLVPARVRRVEATTRSAGPTTSSTICPRRPACRPTGDSVPNASLCSGMVTGVGADVPPVAATIPRAGTTACPTSDDPQSATPVSCGPAVHRRRMPGAVTGAQATPTSRGERRHAKSGCLPR